MCKNKKCGCHNSCHEPKEEYSFCCEKTKQRPCFENVCEEETIDAGQVRYKAGCVNDEESPLINLNIGLGDNQEYINEVFGKKLMDLDYLDSPRLEEYPELDSIEKQMLYLFEKVQILSLNVQELTERIVELEK